MIGTGYYRCNDITIRVKRSRSLAHGLKMDYWTPAGNWMPLAQVDMVTGATSYAMFDGPVTNEAVAAIIAAPPDLAGAWKKSYAEITGRCTVCGRTLTDPESVVRGIGPTCLTKRDA